MSKLPRVCLIGSNGYLGCHLALALDRVGFLGEVLCCDIHESPIDTRFRYLQVDVCNRKAIEEAIGVSDYVFFFSGLIGTSQGFDKFADFVHVNEIGLLNVLDVCRRMIPSPKIIFPSTRLLYKGKKNTALDEESAKEFKTLYAINKFSCEKYLQMYADVFDVRYTVLRICVPYGSNLGATSSYGTLNHFFRQAIDHGMITIYGDGEQKRTFTHIDDLVQVLMDASFSSLTNNSVYNIGGADVLSIRYVAEQIAKVSGARLTFQPWPKLAAILESGDTIFDSRKIDVALGIRYRHRFDDWIKCIAPEQKK